MILSREISDVYMLFRYCITRVNNLLKRKWKVDNTNKITNKSLINELKYHIGVILTFYYHIHFVHLTKSITVHDGYIIQWQCRKFSSDAAFAFYGNAICTVWQPQIHPRKILCQVGNWMQYAFIMFFRYGNYIETRFDIIRRWLSNPVEQFQALASCVDVWWYKASCVTGTGVRFIHRCVVTTSSWKPVTAWAIKRVTGFDYNFGFSWKIFLLFIPVETKWILDKGVNEIYHFTITVYVYPHYLVKLKLLYISFFLLFATHGPWTITYSTFWSQSSQCVRSNRCSQLSHSHPMFIFSSSWQEILLSGFYKKTFIFPLFFDKHF